MSRHYFRIGWAPEECFLSFENDRFYKLDRKMQGWSKVEFEKDFQESIQSLWPKIIRIGKNDVYIISGTTIEREPTRECYKYSIC